MTPTAQQWQTIQDGFVLFLEWFAFIALVIGAYYGARFSARTFVEWWRDEYIDWD